ncbi:MAG: thioredoxin domain-containing protein, partial [Opitutaceae bacterium]
MRLKQQVHAIAAAAAVLASICGCGKRTAVSQNTAPEPPTDKSAAAEPARTSHTNRLSREKSPYLLQHAHNPVEWFPWGEEAFAKAKREDKPIFLSVGYSTCYWCHVMEKQSFEDAEVAKILNEHFVAIKVDREERPDVDEQYMLATQLVTGRGGWPNSVWLTPDGKPWMAGTYFPKPQFMSVLTQLADVWKKRRGDVNKQAGSLAAAIAEAGNATALAGARGELKPEILDRAVATLAGRFEPRYGGFGAAPKFPPHGVLRLLLRQYADKKTETLLTPITKTLDAMWLGGLHDHIGGGFHRYSTDMRWLVPHFEKMLYDNAQLMRSYTDGFLLTKRESYRDAIEDIFRWVRRDMTSPQGAFYSAIDSGEVGKEGEAYTWHTDRVTKVLGPNDGALFAELYRFEKEGNFAEESTRERTGVNIPHLDQPLDELAKKRGEEPKAFMARTAQMREKLLADRQTWPQPHKDDKVLTSWNGLMIASLAYAGRALDEPRYTAAAVRAADFILGTMMRDGVLLRTYRDGEAKLPGYLDDYGYFAQGLIELHRTTGEARWLTQAGRLATTLVNDFQDPQGGGFFFTTARHEDLLMRSKSLGGGGNVPNANGVAVQALLDLATITGKSEYRTAA